MFSRTFLKNDDRSGPKEKLPTSHPSPCEPAYRIDISIIGTRARERLNER